MLTMKKIQQYLLPIAIIVAGILIAGTIYATQHKTPVKERSVAEIAQDALQPKIEVAPVSDADHIEGPLNAKVKLIVYTDPECPYCRIFHGTLQSLYTEHKAAGDLAIVYRMLPLERHPKAPKESEAFECAHEIGGNDSFWKYADTLFANTPSNNNLDHDKLYDFANTINIDAAKFKTCLDSGKYAQKITDSVKAGIRAGGFGTPYSVVQVKDQFIPIVNSNGEGYGALPLNAMGQIVKELGNL